MIAHDYYIGSGNRGLLWVKTMCDKKFLSLYYTAEIIEIIVIFTHVKSLTTYLNFFLRRLS